LHCEDKLVYYLAAGLLELELEDSRPKSLLSSAFDYFKLQQKPTSDWEMLAYTLFLKVAELRDDATLTLSVRTRVRLLFEQE